LIDLSKLTRRDYSIARTVYRMDHSDWEREYQKDLELGNPIMMESSDVIRENVMKPNNNSVFDPRFNIPVETDNKIIEYSCDCGKLIGRYNEGQTCPDCSSVVEIKYSVELLRRGWIDLLEYKIIIPSIYHKIKAYIGKRKRSFIIDEIIHLDTSDPDTFKKDVANPFKGIGMMEFERRYVEVLEYFKQSTTKPELYQILMDRRNITFSSKIYVMSPAHRPGFISTKNVSFNFHNINAILISIIANIRLVKKGDRVGIKAMEILGTIQRNLMQIYELTISRLIGKEKLIRSSIISGRVWYSSRMVIVSETDIDDIDSVKMSYKCFMGMFELEIINCMLKGIGNPIFANMTTPECRVYVNKCKYSEEVDPFIFDIIYKLVHNRRDDGIWVIVNRNPSFDLGSIQCLRVADVFKDAKNNILTIQHNSLVEFNGDFDGDVLNVYAPKELCVIEAFKEGFRPSKLILDRSGGYYNSNMALIKDEYSFLRSFFDKAYKPIAIGEHKFKPLSEIQSSIKFPFNYKKFIAIKTVREIDKKCKVDGYFNDTEVNYDRIEHINESKVDKTKIITSRDFYDSLDKNNKTFNYDPEDIWNLNEFLGA